MNDLISTHALDDHLNDNGLVVLDASWHMPASGRNARHEFEKAHIEGARFFDLDRVSDQHSSLPHMLPSAEDFSKAMAALGINSSSHIVCYDTAGLFSAARCWWMFKAFGHDNVAVLDGGLKKWLAESRPVTSEISSDRRGNFIARLIPRQVKSIHQVAIDNTQIVDARSPARFRGEEIEPRAGVKPGHIPGSKNIHYVTVLNPDGTLKTPNELAEIFASAGIDKNQPITTTCGSGVTAAILALALEQIGAKQVSLYDGSWTEWGSSGRAIETN